MGLKMSLTKKQRQTIFEKSGGFCWYCGGRLPDKGWHADHFVAVIRESAIVRNRPGSEYSHRFVSTGKMHRPENDSISNLVPSCAPCNLFKSTFGIEFFRKEIEAQVDRARRSSVNFRTAERFGLIETKDCKVVFWFERQGLSAAGLLADGEADER